MNVVLIVGGVLGSAYCGSYLFSRIMQYCRNYKSQTNAKNTWDPGCNTKLLLNREVDDGGSQIDDAYSGLVKKKNKAANN